MGRIACCLSFWFGLFCFFLPGFIWLIVEVVTLSKFEKTECEIIDKYYVEHLYDTYEGMVNVPPSATPQYRLPNPINSINSINSNSKNSSSSFSPHSISFHNLFAYDCYASPTDNVVPFFELKYTTKDGKEYTEYSCNFGKLCWTAKGSGCTSEVCDVRISSKICKNFANLKTSSIYDKYDIGTNECWYSKANNDYATIHFPLPNYLWSLFFWIPCFIFCLPILSYYYQKIKKSYCDSNSSSCYCCSKRSNEDEDDEDEDEVVIDISQINKENPEKNETKVIEEPIPKLKGDEDFETMIEIYRNQNKNENENQNENENENYNYEPKENDEIPMEVIQMQMNEYNQQEPQTNQQINTGPLYNPYYQDYSNQENKDF
ncbi:two pore channel 3 [Anaeramoeba ignava]|uniref:Two pore channel 3 n=1 Tax=Anaeramoeba ignava TaxID=1746090 RepID=A0A9Q0LSJ0_ANAIG|nr:two pore channel 3 [Anaeramoeba ignava]